MKKIIGMLFLFVVVFYHIYPQALPIFGFSFVFTSGVLGLIMYFNNGRPYTEIVKIVFAYLFFGAICLLSMYTRNTTDSYLFDNTKSQIGWLFSAYFLIYLFFRIHTRGTFIQLLYYMIVAIVLQATISVLMFQFPAVDEFFSSIHIMDDLALLKREETKGERLLGYGTAFFGAGITYGMGLLLITFVVAKQKLNWLGISILSVSYVFILLVGLLTARTTLVGVVAGIVYLIVVNFYDKSIKRMQFFKFASLAILLGSTGYTLCYLYFPQFSDWAFEIFINYSETGELRTDSSDSIRYMFILPDQFKVWLLGRGSMAFWGSDVGYSRLLFYVGLPGTFAYFFYQYVIVKLAMTKDKAQNFFILTVLGYVLALNVKGLADVNAFLYVFAFYFLYYRYFIYTPHLQRLGKISSNQLRHAIQSPPANGRV